MVGFYQHSGFEQPLAGLVWRGPFSTWVPCIASQDLCEVISHSKLAFGVIFESFYPTKHYRIRPALFLFKKALAPKLISAGHQLYRFSACRLHMRDFDGTFKEIWQPWGLEPGTKMQDISIQKAAQVRLTTWHSVFILRSSDNQYGQTSKRHVEMDREWHLVTLGPAYFAV